MLNVSIRQLRIFVAAARHGSFARAAEEMHISPPAVSMQISDLETSLGLPLFDRVGRSASLTMTGEYFLVHARRILRDCWLAYAPSTPPSNCGSRGVIGSRWWNH
jgi:LysR family transcriptional regulator, low CO2-responsive transcriptional regulator